MKLIAHRGLIYGPDKTLENQPQQVNKILDLGYDCEIDLWIQHGEFYLGHDYAQYPISSDFLNSPGLWIHAKNLSALDWLVTTKLNYFWHQEDFYTLTSHGIIWAYPGQQVTPRAVQVMPEIVDPELKNLDWLCWGICSDYIDKIHSQRP